MPGGPEQQVLFDPSNTLDGKEETEYFHTIIVRQRNNWLQRISQSLLPNASLIRVLVLNLSFTHGRTRIHKLSDEESSHIRRLTGRVRHLAVTWNIWAKFERKCGALQLESLYLIWDRDAPLLDHLQHPSALKDLSLRTSQAQQRERNPNFSTAYLRFYTEVQVDYAKVTSVIAPIGGVKAVRGHQFMADSGVDSTTDSSVENRPESVRVAVPPPEEELHQNRQFSRIGRNCIRIDNSRESVRIAFPPPEEELHQNRRFWMQQF
ncbi:hypothetical protein DFH07DRAFT_783057 [Mycena maculata]|uniref:Uncharacterized protein n=1 Tax=Mycena maculata TaxID=230809 RepID=A0AAD7HPB2_9AGAR|nr:hypothetical protein DFH07DRAFT_783057 [Mycena maculata]